MPCSLRSVWCRWPAARWRRKAPSCKHRTTSTFASSSIVMRISSALRDRVVPRPGVDCAPAMDKSEAQHHRSMRWAQRLQRVFQIDITCRSCGGRLRVMASIEEQSVIDRILAHLGADDGRLRLFFVAGN